MDTVKPDVTIDEITTSFCNSPGTMTGNYQSNYQRWTDLKAELGELDLLQPCEKLFDAVWRTAPDNQLLAWHSFFRMRGDLFRFFRMNQVGMNHVATYEMNVSDLCAARLADRINKIGTDESYETHGWMQ